MGIEDAADLAAFFDPDDFGETLTWDPDGTAAGLATIWIEAHAEIAAGGAGHVSGSRPIASLPITSLPAGGVRGDIIRREATGLRFRIIDIQPDGTGLARIVLEEE
ncbi:MAG: hypothetical protein AAF899_17955 [Pseudomonadota bacterium]